MKYAIGGLVLLVVGFVLGRWSIRPDPALEARVLAYQEGEAAYAAALDSTRRAVAALRARAAEDSVRAATWEARARQAERVAGTARIEADGFRALLAAAATTPDSLAACMGALDARETECAALRATVTGLDSTLAATRDQVDRLRLVTEVQDRQLDTDARRLHAAAGVIAALQRAVRGCRVPLVGWPCPVAAVGYDATDGGVLAGVGLPIRPWLTASVVWRVAR